MDLSGRNTTCSKSINFVEAHSKDGRPLGLERSPTSGSGQPTVVIAVNFICVSYLTKEFTMTSNEIDFDRLFRRISYPQTRERFKALRLATPEDLASTFQASHVDSEKTEPQPNFPPASNVLLKRENKSDLE